MYRALWGLKSFEAFAVDVLCAACASSLPAMTGLLLGRWAKKEPRPRCQSGFSSKKLISMEP